MEQSFSHMQNFNLELSENNDFLHFRNELLHLTLQEISFLLS